LIEFALFSSVLLLMACGVADFSRVFTYCDTVVAAAEAGTQYGALSPAHWGDYTGMQNAALADASNLSNVTATASEVCACSIGGTTVPCPADCSGGGSAETFIKVQVSAPFTPILSYPLIASVSNVSWTSTVQVQ
jgi:Flp pilus assembly protein TadG